MFTIQDQLREEARDFQQLGAMAYRKTCRCIRNRQFYLAGVQQEYAAMCYACARAALLELIGSEPE